MPENEAMTEQPYVFLAGASRGVGFELACWLLQRGVSIRTLLRLPLDTDGEASPAQAELESLGAAIAFGALAGLFHGYAYGESIVGAEPSPLAAYLLGFTLLQAAIAFGAWWLGDRLLRRTSERAKALALPGLAIAGVGLVFLLQAI